MRSWVVAAGCLFMMVSCVGPARTFDAYEADAVATAEEVRSAASTALSGISAAKSGDVTANYLTIVLVESEDAASSAQAQFESVQPPGAKADELNSELSTMLEEATSILFKLRVAVRRSNLQALPRIGTPLHQVVEKLGRFALEHER